MERADTVAELELRIDGLVLAVERHKGTVTLHGGAAIDFSNGGFMQTVTVKYEDFNR